ncbi:MAG: nucleotide exchange factor GrpE [Bryobacteraceae bacterium]
MSTENQDQNQTVDTPSREPAVTAEGEIAALRADRDQLAAEKAELQDLLLRRQADFDNFRRRTERDRSEFVQYAAMETVGALLPILDDFERALKHENSCPEYAKGVELIYQRLFDTLVKTGLEPIETAGQKFDPTLHQALDKAETDEAEDQAILQEYQRGYNFKGKLLRPSLVKVAVRP